jgi:hypothetical protein
MKTVGHLAMVAGVLSASSTFAADLRIPPLHPRPAPASYQFERPPQPAPVTVVPTVPDVAKDAPPPMRDPAPVAPDSGGPTWLERFGPFLKSQLEMIITGSITPPVQSPCETGRGHGAQRSSAACRKPQAHGSKTGQRPVSLLETAPSTGDDVMVRPRMPDARPRTPEPSRRVSSDAPAPPVIGTVTVFAPMPAVQPPY